MPELPEVETVRRGLESRLIDATVADVVVRDRRLRWPIATDFEAQLRGQRIVAIERRSKYLLFRLAKVADTEKSTLLAHLGMTGSFIVHAADSPLAYKSHDHVDVVLTGRRTSGARAFNRPIDRRISVPTHAPSQRRHQAGVDGQHARGGGGQYLCERIAVSRRHTPRSRGQPCVARPLQAAGFGGENSAHRGHRSGRLNAARFRQYRGPTRLLSA